MLFHLEKMETSFILLSKASFNYTYTIGSVGVFVPNNKKYSDEEKEEREE